jgi:hypothetical protein
VDTPCQGVPRSQPTGADQCASQADASVRSTRTAGDSPVTVDTRSAIAAPTAANEAAPTWETANGPGRTSPPEKLTPEARLSGPPSAAHIDW